MLAYFITWLIISFILFTFGDMTVATYNKVCKAKEIYNFVDKVLLGLCSLIIPLSIWSLYLPSNHLFLTIAFFISVSYWAINHRKAFNLLSGFRKKTQGTFTPFQLVMLIALVLIFAFFFTWQQDVYDSAFYHLQNIKWNEEYAVVPGLANLEGKLGFNSNYFLISAIFTFRFFLNESIFPLQPLIVTLISLWVLYELFKSGYEIKRFIILVAYILLFSISIYFLGNTSTDIIPNFIVFYIVARIILYPDLIRKNYLISILLPVFLVTIKLSFFPVGIISLYSLYLIIKEKRYSIISFTIILSLLIIIPWLVRNVIVSGYLIYPLHEIDLFSFDWKVPKEVAIKEKDYISYIGFYFFRTALKYPWMSVRDPLWINILADIVYLLTAASILFICYRFIKRKKDIANHIFLLYAVFILSIIVWVTGGPDIRFLAGVLCSSIFVGGIILTGNKRKHVKALGKSLSIVFIIGIFLWTCSRYYNFIPQIKEYSTHPVSQLLFKPYSVKNQNVADGSDLTDRYFAHYLNSGLILWANPYIPYDMPLPATVHSNYAKFLPIRCIEARGDFLQNGFRAKEGCR